MKTDHIYIVTKKDLLQFSGRSVELGSLVICERPAFYFTGYYLVTPEKGKRFLIHPSDCKHVGKL